MNIRRVDKPEDFIEIFSWLESKAEGKRKVPFPNVSNVAPTWGFLVEEKKEILACLWVYFTGTALAEIAWVEVNPHLDKITGDKALKAIVEEMKLMSSEMNPPIKALRFFSKDERVSNIFRRSGFSKEKMFDQLLWVSKN